MKFQKGDIKSYNELVIRHLKNTIGFFYNITSNQMDIKQWLRSNANESFSPEAYEDIDSRLLFMVKLDSPELPLSLETSYLIADTVGPQLYHDVWYNMTI